MAHLSLMPAASTAAARVIDKLTTDELHSILDALMVLVGEEQPGCPCEDCKLQRFIARQIEQRKEMVRM